MRALIFEPFSGASGDMIIGSLLDLGAAESKIADAISVFDIALEVKAVKKRGIAAKKVAFVSKSGDKSSAKHAERKYADFVRLIEGSGLSREIIENALAVFENLARAEAAVHGEPKESLQFHELGAMDTIGDLVGSTTAFLDLHPDIVICTPVSVGSGFVDTQHGVLPVPAPATVEILRHSSLVSQGDPFGSASELLTPTGAAILAHFVRRFELSLPSLPFRIEKTGYGAGSKDLPSASPPNVLRASLCELSESSFLPTPPPLLPLSRDEVEVLETNVDNVTGEVLGNLIEVLMAEKCVKDVAITPAQMKKCRSGHIIKVITTPQEAARIAYRIMEETGSLGVRSMQVKQRFIANREQRKVKVRLKGVEKEVGVKIGTDAAGNVLNVAAEFEDAKRVAADLNMPLKAVIKLVEETAKPFL
uniref:Putative nickel insertion protein n=1 Tax=Candidatus Methanophagaceae archaeon ANME-1 ERB6 TaxID=2759912 RepID=A0A7G9YYQ2_9EURY|nr:pyridinium-3,5-bisthiocarboxylic acid mononucleotide nickel insertion protein [Methanosarcinales archaeon ANME-1 ERB6]